MSFSTTVVDDQIVIFSDFIGIVIAFTFITLSDIAIAFAIFVIVIGLIVTIFTTEGRDPKAFKWEICISLGTQSVIIAAIILKLAFI